MSIVDPAEARRRRALQQQGSPAALRRVVFWDLVLVVGATLLARALFAFAAVPSEQENPPAIWIAAAWVGLPAVILGLSRHADAVRRYRGSYTGGPFPGPLALLLVGFAAGSWWGSADAVAVLLWIPLVVTAVAVLAIIVAVLRRARRNGNARELAAVLVAGRIVPGVITGIAEIDPSSGGLIGPITVRFTDTAGVDRWVTKTGQWSASDLPRDGDSVDVLFDPAEPGNVGRIWIGPEGSRDPADFSRWAL